MFSKQLKTFLITVALLCSLFIFAACDTLNTIPFPQNTVTENDKHAIPNEDTHETQDNIEATTKPPDNSPTPIKSLDKDLIQIFLVEKVDGIDPWDNNNLEKLNPIGNPLITSECFTGYYSKCTNDSYPNPDLFEVVPGEGSDRGLLCFADKENLHSEFYKAFYAAGGKDGEQYGVLVMSKEEKLFCCIFDSGSELATPQNCQAGLFVSKKDIGIGGGFGDFNFSKKFEKILPENLYFTPEKQIEKYDALAISSPLSALIFEADEVSLYSGMRDEIIFSTNERTTIANYLDNALYVDRLFRLSDEELEDRIGTSMDLKMQFPEGTIRFVLYENMETFFIRNHKVNNYVHFDEAYYMAPEFINYLDNLSQNGMPKLNEISNISKIQLKEDDNIVESITDKKILSKTEEYLSESTRVAIDRLHGSIYKIILTTDGVDYTVSPETSAKNVLVFDGHQYSVPSDMYAYLEKIFKVSLK